MFTMQATFHRKNESDTITILGADSTSVTAEIAVTRFHSMIRDTYSPNMAKGIITQVQENT